MIAAASTTNDEEITTSEGSDTSPKNYHRVWWLVAFFKLDLVLSSILLLPFIPV